MAEASFAQRVRDALRRPLFGPDIFISYSRHNRPYVEKLAARLHEKRKRLTIVTDRVTSKPAETMHEDLTALVRTSSMMVLVLTKDSLASNHVRTEIETFRAYDRPLVPVHVGDAMETWCQWNDQGLMHYVRSPGLQPENEVTLGDVEKNILPAPSGSVVDAIVDSISFRLQTDRIRWAAGGALALLVAVMVVSFLLIDSAEQKRDAALRESAAATRQAAVARAAEVTANANAKTAQLAATAANAEAEAARKDAEEQTRLANVAKEAAAFAQNEARLAGELAARRQQIAQGLRMAADSVNVLRQAPYLVDTSTLLGAEAMDRLERIDQRSVVADIALRDALAVLPEVERPLTLPKPSHDAALSKDGRFVVSATDDGIVLCASSDRECRTIVFEEHGLGAPDVVAISADGGVVAASHGTNERGCVHLLGNRTDRIKTASRPTCIALSHDGSGTAFVMESGVAAHPSSKSISVSEVRSLEWSPDNEHLVMTASGGGTIVWSSKTGDRTDLPTEQAGGATFSPDGLRVATFQQAPPSPDPKKGFEPLRLWTWSTKKSETIGDAQPPFASVAFSRDGAKFAAAQLETGVHVYELSTGYHMLLPGEPGLFAFNGDGTRIAVGENHRTSRLWSLSRPPRELARWRSEVSRPFIAIREDGSVVTAAKSDTMWVWRPREWVDERIDLSRAGAVMAATRDPRDGSVAAAFRNEAMIGRIDADGTVKECKGLAATATSLAFRGDGALLVATDRTVKWARDWCSGKPVSTNAALPRATPAQQIYAVATDRGGNVVALGVRNGVEVYRDGKALGYVPRPGPAIRSLAVDAEGRYLAVAEAPEIPQRDIRKQPYQITIWDLGRPLSDGPLRTIARAFPVGAMAFDPSGSALAVAAGSSVHVMDRWLSSDAAREIARLVMPRRVGGLAFSNDGTQLTAVADHGHMLVSRWRPPDLVSVACGALNTPWTADEWRAYNADLPFQPTCGR